jgi:hypothetical protein
MKKYVSLLCSACSRQKDELIDLTHFAPDRCTITLGCEGRLSPIGYTSEGTSVLSIPPTGLSNWYPRGTTETTGTTIKSESLYDTSTGVKQQIVIAVPVNNLGFVPSEDSELTVLFSAEKQTAKDFRQYTFRRSSPFTIVNGVEDAQAKKVLRYSTTGANPDKVEVYVNGVKRDLGVDYLLNDGVVGSSVPPNSVLFTETLTGTTQVDVIVSKATAANTTQIVFSRMIDDESRVGTGAWEGVDYVTNPVIEDWALFYCDFKEISSVFVNGVGLDVKLRFDSASIKDYESGPTYPVTFSAMLLSRTKVYTPIDRQRAKCVPLKNLNTDTDYLVVKTVDGVRSMLVTEASSVDVFPLLEAVRFKAPKLVKSQLRGNDGSAELDNQIINGPDA